MYFINLLLCLYEFLVTLRSQKKLSTTKKPCLDDKSYNLFKCMETHYSEQRGYQFPWNANKDLNIRICNNYSEIFSTRNLFDRDKGYLRKDFSYAEHLRRGKNKCMQPCSQHHYEIKFERWAPFAAEGFVSLQIAFEEFTVVHTEEYLNCEITCIIGEVGGNLGFFLGGSILLGIDIIFTWFKGIAARMSFRDKPFNLPIQSWLVL